MGDYASCAAVACFLAILALEAQKGKLQPKMALQAGEGAAAEQ